MPVSVLRLGCPIIVLNSKDDIEKLTDDLRDVAIIYHADNFSNFSNMYKKLFNLLPSFNSKNIELIYITSRKVDNTIQVFEDSNISIDTNPNRIKRLIAQITDLQSKVDELNKKVLKSENNV